VGENREKAGSVDVSLLFTSENLQYIIPLRRNNPLIDFSVLSEPDFKRNIRFFSKYNTLTINNNLFVSKSSKNPSGNRRRTSNNIKNILAKQI
jgi:hypothetical protein